MKFKTIISVIFICFTCFGESPSLDARSISALGLTDADAADKDEKYNKKFLYKLLVSKTLGWSSKIDDSISLPIVKHGIPITKETLPKRHIRIDVAAFDKKGEGRMPLARPRISIEGKNISLNDISLVLKDVQKNWGERFPILICADERTPHEAMRLVMDQCTMAGFWKFSFMAKVDGDIGDLDIYNGRFSIMNVSRPIPAVSLDQKEIDRLKKMGLLIEEKQEEVESKEEEPPPPDPEESPVEFEIDNPMPGPPTDMTSPSLSVTPAPVESVHNAVSPVKMCPMVQFRNPGAIGARTRGGAGYGDLRTEECVMKVLWWLKGTQNADGSWSSRSIGNNRLINTSLAILTYLAHGEYPGSESPYKKDFGPVVRKAIQYVMSCVEETSSGIKMKGSDGNEYAFLISTYALCEAYCMTKNPDVKDAAILCLERIIKCQTSTGGWDYQLDKNSTSDDVFAAGWALQALKAGKLAGLCPDGLDDCIKKAIRCLKIRNFNNGTFRSASENVDCEEPGLAAAGCLALQLHGCGSSDEVSAALNYMRNWKPSFDGKDILHNGKPHSGNVNPQLYCYFATQCKYFAGMKEGARKADKETWFAWNKEMKILLTSNILSIDAMVKDWSGSAHRQGYFKNDDRDSSRPYMDTCLVALQLMVYYRYLPTTQVIDKGDITVDDIEL
jgi:hypothetical protein